MFMTNVSSPTTTPVKVKDGSLGWFGIVRLGLVQTCIGAIVVMTTSTLNRIMVVELSLPALIPGLLVALHYFVQVIRPKMGFISDQGKHKTPWIIGGMSILAIGGAGASLGTALMGMNLIIGLVVSFFAFVMIGIGVSISGTSLLALLAKSVNDQRRAAAATIVWLMMIFGFAITSVMIGKLIDPYTPEKVVMIACGVSLIAVLVTTIALYSLENSVSSYFHNQTEIKKDSTPFKQALVQMWKDSDIRHFTQFIFISMLAFSSQDLILEPFAGIVFNYTVGQTTSLSGLQHSGVLLGMLMVPISGISFLRKYVGSLNLWVIYGCIASAIAMAGLCIGALIGPAWPLHLNVFLLGVANGAFSIAAISTMMRLAVADGLGKEGVRIGLWGGAQAIAFGLGGLLGAIASDAARLIIADTAHAYSSVFAVEAFLFIVSAKFATRIQR
jgi:BCD family chlorophyll transporter-like MFS transporter